MVGFGRRTVLIEQRDRGGFEELPVDRRLQKALRASFARFLDEEIPEPWVATRILRKNYLRPISFAIYLRGQRDKPNQPYYHYVQLSFSGCAGMADTSSALAAHWAEVWCKKRTEFIETELLRPYQLEPTENPALVLEPEETFIPAGEYGYASFVPAKYRAKQDADDERPVCFFMVDACWHEAHYAGLGDGANIDFEFDVVNTLNREYAELMSDGRCRCQLCMPEFDATRLDQFKV